MSFFFFFFLNGQSRALISFFCIWISELCHLLKRLFFPLCDYFGSPVEKQLTINVRVYFWTLNSIHGSVFILCQHHTDSITVALR